MAESETTVAGINLNEAAEEVSLSKQVSQIEVQAKSIAIKNEQDYKDAAEFGRFLKQKTAQVKEFWKPMKDAAHKAHAEICGKEKTMLEPLQSAEKTLKRTMGEYVQEQERKRKEAEEEARKAALEEAERKVREAVALEASGDITAAEAAIEEAEIMDDAAASVAVAASNIRAKGVAHKTDWEIVSIDSDKVPVSVMGTEIRPVDTAAVMRLIRSSKGQVKIEGIVYKEKTQISFRK